MSTETLEAGLRSLGISCRVETQERLAVLVPDGPIEPLEDAAVRREAVALLRAHGFTHLALELVDEPADASLRRR